MSSESLSFERIAKQYDATRGIPADEVENVMWGMLELTQPTRATRFVELGVGTGRIARPLLAWGQRVYGFDLSLGMLAQCRAQMPATPLAQADVTRVPLMDAGADVVVLVHVLHLIPGWRAVLGEVRRVLAPRGVLLHSFGTSDESAPEAPSTRLFAHFAEFVAARGEPMRRRGAQSVEEVRAALQETGASFKTFVVAEWPTPYTLAELIHSLATRSGSRTWALSEATHSAAVAELQVWAEREFGDLTQPLTEDERVVFDVVKWG